MERRKIAAALLALCLVVQVSVAQNVQERTFGADTVAHKQIVQPRGINELLFSLAHVRADSLNTMLSQQPLMLHGYMLPEPVIFSLDTALLLQGLTRPARSNLPEIKFSPSRADEIVRELVAGYLIHHPGKAQYLSWTLPEPPQLLPEKDVTDDFLVADIAVGEEATPMPGMLEDVKRTNWLHKTDASLQFSQAYLSPNWYQGGNNSLSLLVNLLWDVRLNEVYHPSLLFESTLSYKLGLNSTPQDSLHKYSVSQDLLQYNMKFGVRAKHKWFYSFTTQFKTQLLNVYGENSSVRKAAFLSPGELNLGLGMTYSTSALKNNLKLNVSLAPLSYNLKTCIDNTIDPTQFGIKAHRHTQSQVGSNAEVTLNWNLHANISWRSRFFLFTNYDDFQGDWENTFNFAVNKFLSTQIYVHLRYDTGSEAVSKHWRHWMLKEILSFGFRYAFSTK